MKEVISGFAFHCHHEIMVEWVTDYDERVNYIKKVKPKKEQKLRLRLFKMIPVDKLPANLLKARAEYVKVSHHKAWAGHHKAWAEYDKARAEYVKARHDKAWAKCDKAADEYDKAWAKCDFTALHKELCPNCTWNGNTIFPEGEKK